MKKALDRDLLLNLATAPDHALSSRITSLVATFAKEDHTAEEITYFLRDMRDLAIFGGEANGFVMAVFAALLPDEEDPQEAKARQENVLERYVDED